MNKERRKAVQKTIEAIKECLDKLNEIAKEISVIESEESDSFDNMPEGLQMSDRGCDMQNNIDNLIDVEDNLDNVIDQLENDVLDKLCEVD